LDFLAGGSSSSEDDRGEKEGEEIGLSSKQKLTTGIGIAANLAMCSSLLE